MKNRDMGKRSAAQFSTTTCDRRHRPPRVIQARAAASPWPAIFGLFVSSEADPCLDTMPQRTAASTSDRRNG